MYSHLEHSSPPVEAAPAERNAITLGEQTIYLTQEQVSLLGASVHERNTNFEDRVAQLCRTDGSDLPRDELDNYIAKLKHRAVTTFAEPSLVGTRVGAAEWTALRAYQQAADEVVARAGDDPLRFQFLDRVRATVEAQQEALKHHGIEAGDAQYWHFTPRIRDLARAGLLKSGAHPDITNFTGDHSKGVHFVSPSQSNIDWMEEWRNFAYHTHTLENGKPIPGAFGAAVVAPLARLVLDTPIRNEQKLADHMEQPFANDATFRTADEGALYAYELGDTYIMPCSSRQQLNDTLHLNQTEALRNIFLAAGYDKGWISHHLIEFTAHHNADQIHYSSDIAPVFNKIARHLRSQYEGVVVVPLTSKPGRLEQLDGSPEPRIERLLVATTEPTRAVPPKKAPHVHNYSLAPGALTSKTFVAHGMYM